MTTKIEPRGCDHPRRKDTCIWCVAKADHGDTVSRIVVNRDDGYAFVTVDGINLMYEEGTGGRWQPARPNFSNAT